MGWLTRGGRWLPFTAVVVLVAVVPDTRPIAAAPSSVVPPLIAAAIVASDVPFDEPKGMVLRRMFHGTATPTPTVSTSPAQVFEGELNPGKAPVPPGPATYVPILLHHYIRLNPVASDWVGFGLSTPPAAFRL